jgi:hypothetical protein
VRLPKQQRVEVSVEGHVVVDHDRRLGLGVPQQVRVAGNCAHRPVCISHPPVERHQVAPKGRGATRQQRRFELPRVRGDARAEGQTRSQIVVAAQLHHPLEAAAHLHLSEWGYGQSQRLRQVPGNPFADKTAPPRTAALDVEAVAVISTSAERPCHTLLGTFPDFGDDGMLQHRAQVVALRRSKAASRAAIENTEQSAPP